MRDKGASRRKLSVVNFGVSAKIIGFWRKTGTDPMGTAPRCSERVIYQIINFLGIPQVLLYCSPEQRALFIYTVLHHHLHQNPHFYFLQISSSTSTFCFSSCTFSLSLLTTCFALIKEFPALFPFFFCIGRNKRNNWNQFVCSFLNLWRKPSTGTSLLYLKWVLLMFFRNIWVFSV